MKPSLPNLATADSLLLAIAIVVLWVRKMGGTNRSNAIGTRPPRGANGSCNRARACSASRPQFSQRPSSGRCTLLVLGLDAVRLHECPKPTCLVPFPRSGASAHLSPGPISLAHYDTRRRLLAPPPPNAPAARHRVRASSPPTPAGNEQPLPDLRLRPPRHARPLPRMRDADFRRCDHVGRWRSAAIFVEPPPVSRVERPVLPGTCSNLTLT